MAAVAEKAAAAETEDEARARERAAAEQIAHEKARKDFVTPLASVEDAISSEIHINTYKTDAVKYAEGSEGGVAEGGGGAAAAAHARATATDHGAAPQPLR
ncbi:hypothetical protein OsJ_14604 [Oryza sativa Japonica Group]|uniref:Uncharacterized protein n=1 Tax=Oryza sativa subsp. japonica TaxID=39947 RepID=B9FEX4_ORYSJ|nr:hypothetical protein OsJ_14604 [Oryza sativa Japonica Group]